MSTGFVHSIQTMGTLDGPGVRFVVFVQGCNLRCHCCHNPDTWEVNIGHKYDAKEISEKVLRYKEYFGKDGGITVSGGEPLLQAEFVYELFSLCHKNGINTCLDTSGCILNAGIKKLLSVTDRVLLDIKYTNDGDYRKYVGCSIDAPIRFLEYLNSVKIPVTLRQVIIPTINDAEDNIIALKRIADSFKCVDKVELLPFKNICQVKYDQMGIEFPFGNISPAPKETIENLQKLL